MRTLVTIPVELLNAIDAARAALAAETLSPVSRSAMIRKLLHDGLRARECQVTPKTRRRAGD